MRKQFQIYLSILGFFFLPLSSFCAQTLPFSIQAHRGARGLRPENTISAFNWTLQNDLADTLEMDVVVTKDGIVVLSHDRFLNPQKVQKDGKFIQFPVFFNTLNYEQLQSFTVGVMRSDYSWPEQISIPQERIPTLEEVLTVVKDYMQTSGKPVFLNIETKIAPDRPTESPTAEAFVSLLLSVIQKYEMQKWVIIQSFYWDILRIVYRQDASIQLSALYSIDFARRPGFIQPSGKILTESELFDLLKELSVTYFSPSFEMFEVSWVQRAHDNGIKILPWTINLREDMEKFIQYGVDGIITDYPDRLKEVISNRVQN